MTTHEPQDTHYKWELFFSEPPRSVEVRRVPCSCGWLGRWCEDADQAMDSFRWHVERATAKPHVVGCICRTCASAFVYEAI